MFAVALKAVAITVATGALSLPNQESQIIHFFDYSILTVSSLAELATYLIALHTAVIAWVRSLASCKKNNYLGCGFLFIIHVISFMFTTAT